MGALGYTRNKEQFEELACRLPLAVMQNLCRGKPVEEQVKVIKALLLGMAGLLPDDEKAEPESLKYCLGNREPMRPSSWRVFRVRPENHPVRRLSGAAYLLARFMNEGLLEGVLRLLDESSSDIGQLDAGFMVSGQSFCSHGERALIIDAARRARHIETALVSRTARLAWKADGGQRAGVDEPVYLCVVCGF